MTAEPVPHSINHALYKLSFVPAPPAPEEPLPLPSPAHIRSTVASIVDQPDDLRELRVFHKALADVNRLRIVQRLAQGPASVGDLIETVGLSQPLVSWHVGRLKAAGIVRSKRAGRETLCELQPDAFERIAEQQRRLLLGLPNGAPAAAATASTPAAQQAKRTAEAH